MAAFIRPHAAARATLVLCVVVFIACYCSTPVTAADMKPGDASGALKLQHPLGSGLNVPKPLGFTPRRGRRFINLMREFVQAARGGNLELAQKIQQQLFALTKPKHHRRNLLQPAEDACPALPNTEEITTPNIPPSGAQTSTGPAGPLPSIRYYTLEPCAEFGCRTKYMLVRQSDGTITCKGPKNTPRAPGVAAPVPAVAVEDFAYFKVYDYDLFWNTDDDNVIAGGYAGSTLTNTNQWTSARGALNAKTNLGTDTQVRIEPNPYLGVRADTAAAGELNTGVAVSKAVGDAAVLNFKTALPVLTAQGAYGAVLPGTVVTDREGEASDNNVVFRSNNPALFGYFGKKKH